MPYSALGKEILQDAREIETKNNELRKYLKAGDYQAFESKYNEFYARSENWTKEAPLFKPFEALDQKLSQYYNEKPAGGQIASAALVGVAERIGQMADNPGQTAAFAAGFIALGIVSGGTGYVALAASVALGGATGYFAYQVGSESFHGAKKISEGYLNNDHAQMMDGAQNLGGVAADLGMAYLLGPKGKSKGAAGEIGAPKTNVPPSPPLRAAAQSKPAPPPEPLISQPKLDAPQRNPQEVGLGSHNRYKLERQLNDFIKRRFERFDEIRNTLDNAARNGGGGKKPNNPAAPGSQTAQPELVGAGVSPKPIKGDNVKLPPKIAQKQPASPNETGAAANNGAAAAPSGAAPATAKSLAEVLKQRGLADEQIAAVEKLVSNSDEIKNALEAAKGNVQLTDRINQMIAQTAKKFDAATDANGFTNSLLGSFKGGHIPYSVEKNIGTIADAIPALKAGDPAAHVNRRILDKAYPEFSKLLQKLDKPEFRVLKQQIEKVLNGEKPDGKGGFTSGDKLNYKLDRKFDGAREDLMGHLNEVIGRNLQTAEERGQFLQLWRESGASVQGLNTNAGSIGEHFFYKNLLGSHGFEKTKLPIGNGNTIDPDFGLNQGILGNIKTVGESVTPSKFGDIGALFQHLKTPHGRQEIYAALAKTHGDAAAAGFVKKLNSYLFHIQGNGKAALADVERAAQDTFRSSENFLASLPGGTRTNPRLRVTFEGANGKVFEIIRDGEKLVSRELENGIGGLQRTAPHR